MDKLLAWKKFISTGSVDNYLSYCRTKRPEDDALNFIKPTKFNPKERTENALKKLMLKGVERLEVHHRRTCNQRKQRWRK